MREKIKIILSIILFIIAIIVPDEVVKVTMYILSYIIVGYDVIKEAIENILKGKFLDENFLMTIATIGALIIKEYPEAVMVMLLYNIGEIFEEYATEKSKKSITELMDIRPDYANVIRNGKTIKLNPAEVKINETIIIKPGEKIPLDGIVIEGTSMIDTKALTGESVPQKAEIGDEIISGTINQTGVLKINVTKEFGESTVSKILDLVQNVESEKSKSENFITKFAKYYTPIVVIIAIMLATIPTAIMGINTINTWLYRALSFLVVSCPCALVISIPLTFFAGIGGASKKGILIKGSNYIELLSKTDTVVFDKTGTLTEGVFEVQKIKANKIEENELLKIVAYAENYSNHPIAVSIKKAYGKEIEKNVVTDIQEISGYGIKAKVFEKDILIGNETLLKQNNIEIEKSEESGTIVYVAVQGEYAGYILIADKIKQDAKKTIKELSENNVNKTIMLTGDRKETGEYVANKIGIKETYAELLPDGKVEKIKKLLKEEQPNKTLAFVGDGINDTPVLKCADIGIAMGGLGSDSVIETADIVIMTDEPSKINDAIKISKKTMKIVKQNTIFAIGVKFIVLILSAIGIGTMWEAVFADVGVTVLASLNAMRAMINK